jgi:hypothetical protein
MMGLFVFLLKGVCGGDKIQVTTKEDTQMLQQR